jgi:putative FmdB family regulatory protein
MPFYQYSCRDCGHPFEKKLPMSQADEVQSCPCCASRDTRKRLTSFAVGGVSRSTNMAPALPRFT